MHSVGDLHTCLFDFNGHVGRHIKGFDEGHGGYGVQKKNVEGRMSLEIPLVKEICVSNTWLKREKSKMASRMG